MKYIELARAFHPMVTDDVIVEACCCSDYNPGDCVSTSEGGCKACYNAEVPAETVESLMNLTLPEYLVVLIKDGNSFGIFPFRKDEEFRMLAFATTACGKNGNFSLFKREGSGWIKFDRVCFDSLLKRIREEAKK